MDTLEILEKLGMVEKPESFKEKMLKELLKLKETPKIRRMIQKLEEDIKRDNLSTR